MSDLPQSLCAQSLPWERPDSAGRLLKGSHDINRPANGGKSRLGPADSYRLSVGILRTG